VNALEFAARQAWRDWAVYQKWTCCHLCAELRYCGAARSRRRWLCFECFDQVAAS
jgi:hypothetical protein